MVGFAERHDGDAEGEESRFADELMLLPCMIGIDRPSIGRPSIELLRRCLDGEAPDQPTRHVPLVLDTRVSI